MIKRRAVTTGLLASALAVPAWRALAQSSQKPVRIGIIGDLSGPFVDNIGMPFVNAAEMAAEDFGGTVAGRPIEILHADDATKADISLSVARRWLDNDDVSAIITGSTSAIALGLSTLTNEKNKILVLAGSGNSDVTGKLCNDTTFQFGFDTYSLPKSAVVAAMKKDLDTWFIVSLDYAFGHQIEATAKEYIEAGGGKVVGAVRHPLNTSDFSSFILQAQASGAKAIAIANGGADLTNFVKQAREFGIDNKSQILVPMAAFFPQINSLGPEIAQGMLFSSYFYWNYDDRTRAWSERQMARSDGKVPDVQQAGCYSAVLHYLKAVEESGSTDGSTVGAAMKSLPVNDALLTDVEVRQDGQLMRPIYLAEAKAPADIKEENDILRIVQEISAEEGMRTLEVGACPLVKL